MTEENLLRARLRATILMLQIIYVKPDDPMLRDELHRFLDIARYWTEPGDLLLPAAAPDNVVPFKRRDG